MSKKRKLLIIGALAVWICFIFGNSLQSSTRSGAVSKSVTGLANRLLESLSGDPLTEHMIRKAAHFLEYTALGVLLCVLLYTLWASPVRVKIPLVMLFGLGIPLLDETIQLFAPGRSSEVTDVLLDFFGVLFGFTVAWAIRMGWQWRRKKRTAGPPLKKGSEAGE